MAKMRKKPLVKQDIGKNWEIVWNTDSKIHLFFFFFFLQLAGLLPSSSFNSMNLRYEANAITPSGTNDVKILQIALNAADTVRLEIVPWEGNGLKLCVWWKFCSGRILFGLLYG